MENYLVLHKTRDRSFLIKDGYRYLCELRKMMVPQFKMNPVLMPQSPEDRHKFLQFMAFLKQIGFLATELDGTDKIKSLTTKIKKPETPLNDALFDEISNRVSRDNILENLYIEITKAIDSVPGNSGEQKAILSGNQFDQLFLQFEAMGGKRVVFAGAEPFGWSGFIGLLRKTANYGFGIEIVTDGARLTPRIVSLLQKLKIDNLVISMNENNAKQVQDKDNETKHRKAKMAMLLLKQNGIRYTAVCPVTNNIRNSISFFSQLAARTQEILPDPSSPSMDQQLTQSELAHNCSNQEGFHFSDPHRKVSVNNPENSRPGTKRTIHVLITGEVYLGYNRTFSLGNIHCNPLLDICKEKLR